MNTKNTKKNKFNRFTNFVSDWPAKSLFLPVVLAAWCAHSAHAGLQPELLFKDTFDVSQNSTDINFENGNGRQSGKVGVLTYTVVSPAPDAIQLDNADSPGKLRLQSVAGNVYASPDHNFTEGGHFIIEFEATPAIDDTAHTSGDWCAIVFGTTMRNVFVNASDGMGILFRSDGRIEVWDGATAAYSGALSAGDTTPGTRKVRIEVTAADFNGSPATIAMFVNDVQVQISGDGLTRLKQAGFKGNYITLEGIGLWTHTFDNLSISAVPAITVSPNVVEKTQGQTSDPITLTIPPPMNATQAVAVAVVSLDPTIAVPTGADAGGKLILNFAAKATNVQTFTVKALKGGKTTLVITNDLGVDVQSSIQVNVSAGVGLPQVFFQDNFNTTAANNDINFQNSGGRQNGGSLGVLAYSEAANTAAGGVNDEWTQVNPDSAPGKLMISVTGGLTWVSPNYNFIDAGTYTVEFKVDVTTTNPARDSSDWAAVVLGASTKGAGVNGSDGLGILWRNNGIIQVFDGTALAFDSTASGAILPEGEMTVRLEVSTFDFTGTSPATVSMFINGAAVPISANGASYTKASGFKGNYITMEGYANTGSTWSYTFDDLKISGLAGVKATPLTVLTTAGLSNEVVTVTIPTLMIATNAATVTITSQDPTIAVPQGAVNGSLNLDFAANGPVSKTFQVVGLKAGNTTFNLSNNRGIAVGQSVAVEVLEVAPVVLSDDFSKPDIQSIWRRNDKALETGTSDVTIAPTSGKMEFNVTATANYWGGASLATEVTFSAGPTTPVTFTIDRVAHTPAPVAPSVTRSGVWITDQSRSKYVFFSDNEGEGGWQYNRLIGQTGDNGTGTGANIAAFDGATFDDGGKHQMRLMANGSTVKLFLDGILGAEVSFPVTSGIVFEFGAYTRSVNSGDAITADFDNATVTSALPVALPCIAFDQANLTLLPASTNGLVTVTVPSLLLKTNAATVTLTSQNPAIASPIGAVNGVLTLQFPIGSANTQSVAIAALNKGITTISLADTQNVCVAASLGVTVSGTFVANPSFEANYNTTFPGYSSIDSWQGGSGVNQASGPFHDQGVIPDRSRVAFIQGSATLSQSIQGLVPGQQYWLQFRYNTRNCCGGTIDLTARFAGTDLLTIPGLTPVGGANPYNYASVAFTPASDTGVLEFATTAAGDATALLDAVTIVPRGTNQVVITNPSFEAEGIPAYPGYLQPARISGWTGDGNYGVNFTGVGPFADNGVNSDQDAVAFIQGKASLSQTISNLTVGQTYTLAYSYNARSGNAPRLTVTFAGQTAQDSVVTPVGGMVPYYKKYYAFTAQADTAALSFAQTADGDNTALIDDVQIFVGEPPIGPSMTIARGANNTVIISWPKTASTYTLQSAPTIKSDWATVNQSVTDQGTQWAVTITIQSTAQFYQLRK